MVSTTPEAVGKLKISALSDLMPKRAELYHCPNLTWILRVYRDSGPPLSFFGPTPENVLHQFGVTPPAKSKPKRPKKIKAESNDITIPCID